MLGLVLWGGQLGLRAVWPFTIDDAGISYAYAKHIAEGAGPVAAVGGPWVEGYSNALWVLCLVPFHWLGLPLPLVAKVLGCFFFVAALLAANRYLAQLEGQSAWRSRAPDVLFVLGLAWCVEFVVWVPAGLENALFAALLIGLAQLDAAESRDPSRRGLSGLLAFALCITRPEGALYAAPLLLLKAARARSDRAFARQALTFFAAWFGPWLSYQVLHYVVFRQLLPNTYYAKPQSRDWADGLEYLSSNLQSSGALYVLPLALLGCIGRLRQKFLLLWYCIAGVGFVVYSGGDWMPHGRFLALFLPALGLLAACGVQTLAAFVSRVARGRPNEELLRSILVTGLLAAWWVQQRPRLEAVAARPWCHFCERVSDTSRLIEIGRRAQLSSVSLLTQDFGGPAWLSDEHFYPIDFLGLCDRGIALIRRDRQRLGGPLGKDYRLYQAALHEPAPPPSWLHLPRNFWAGFDLSLESRRSYFQMDPRLLPRSRRDAFFGLHRSELVDYFPPLGAFEFRPLGDHLTLVGSAQFADAEPGAPLVRAEAGGRLRSVVSLVPRGKLSGTERLKLRVESGAQAVESAVQPLARGLRGISAQLRGSDALAFEFTLALPAGDESQYRVALGLSVPPRSKGSRGKARERVPDHWRWTTIAELRSGEPLPVYSRELPRYPAALPPPLAPELGELRVRVTRAVEARRRGGNLVAVDAELVRRLLELGESLEARALGSQAYLAYVWATHVDPSVGSRVSDAVFRLRPAMTDDRYGMELALLGSYYEAGTAAALMRLIGFYASTSQLAEAEYFLARVPSGAREEAALVAFREHVASARRGGTAAAHAPAEVLGRVARDPLGGAFDFEIAALPGWERDAAFMAGAGPEHSARPGLWGAHGQGLLSSLAKGRRGRGRSLSPEFTIDGTLLSLLVGGGGRRRGVGVELLVEGRAVLSATGGGSDALLPVLWDVSPYAGQRARLRVYDESARDYILLDRVLLWR